MNVTKTQLTPATPPLPMAGASINPEWVLYKLQKFSNRFSKARTIATGGKICFESLIWDGNSDVSSRRDWAAFKHWLGVFMEGFDPAHLMSIEPCYNPGRLTYIDTKYRLWIEEWIYDSIFALECFIREYPGEEMRRMDLSEKAVLGKSFGISSLRLRGKH